MKERMLVLVVALFVVMGSFGQKMEQPAKLKKTPEIVITHKAYTLSYNIKTNTPNWVAWELTADEASATRVRRSKDFFPDPQVPRKNRLEGWAYKGTGYDRGHMCPAGDNKWDVEAMNECFYMSNMCPQDRTLNGTWWEHLESACRRWAVKEGSVYIVCGPVYKNAAPRMVGNGVDVAVPDGFFKVVLSLRKGKEKAIGFYYSNDGSRQTMSDAACSVDEIEKITGMDFFPMLDDKLERRVESEYKLSAWQ